MGWKWNKRGSESGKGNQTIKSDLNKRRNKGENNFQRHIRGKESMSSGNLGPNTQNPIRPRLPLDMDSFPRICL